ncbi:MAG: hypothetical protein CENE_02251 [Candidatus Celerinatantimonas neptuna]|nr:MAG: hypothetical protein CENE_02251 [Candidatus Celerinatantimonas neptuna]
MSLSYPWWHAPIDPFLTINDIGYGIGLIRLSMSKPEPDKVRLSDITKTRHMQLATRILLWISALTDALIAIDFTWFGGMYDVFFVSISQGVLLPLLYAAILMISFSIHQEQTTSEVPADLVSPRIRHTNDHIDILSIIGQFKKLMQDRALFLDPDLTLNRISRRLGIPSKQLSITINQHYGRNISQVINEYCIERAKKTFTRNE